MNKIKCMIVDDEPLAVELLTDYIARCGFLELSAAFGNPLEALEFVRAGQVDLIFLDIQMQELNGFQFMRLLQGKCQVVLITAYPGYALKGYEMNVLDYLLKPVLFERFLQAVQKWQQPAVVSGGLQEAEEEGSLSGEALFVKSGHKIIRVKLQDILYIEGRREYVAVQTPETAILSIQSLARIETLLRGRPFVRVHKSYIVSLNAIDSIEHNRIFIAAKVIPVGETYRARFFQVLGKGNLL